MRKRKATLIMTSLLVALMLTISTVKAQEGELSRVSEAQVATVNINPIALTFAGVKGESMTRSIIVEVPEGEITDLEIFSTDLSNSDGTKVMPFSAITAESDSTTVTPDNPARIYVVVDLTDISSAEYTGDLQLKFSGGSESVIMTVKVKDPWFLPALTVLIGVFISGMFSYYRTQVKPRDEVEIMLGRLQREISGDEEFSAHPKLGWPFYNKVITEISKAKNAFEKQAPDWEAAKSAASDADKFWDKWSTARAEWVDLMGVYNSIQEKTDSLLSKVPQSDYLEELRREAKDAAVTAPDAQSTRDFEVKLSAVNKKQVGYIRSSNAIEAIRKDWDQKKKHASTDQQLEWEGKINELVITLNDLSPDDLTGRNKLNTAIEKTHSDLDQIQLAKPSRTAGLTAGTRSVMAGQQVEDLFKNLATSGISFIEEARGARTRQEVFKWATILLSLLILSAFGYWQLYVLEPVFGAAAWSSYFGLLIWGFGAEATRASLTSVISGWGIDWIF